MSELKCPFCMQKMNKSENNMFYCGTYNCSLRHVEIPKKAVEEFAESHQNRLNDCKRIGNMNEELIRTRKALYVAVDALKLLNSEGKRTRILGLISITDTALDKIKTTLE